MLFEIGVALCLVVFTVTFYSCYWKRRPFPPGPTPLPLFGNSLELVADGKSVKQAVSELRTKCGPVCTFWLGGVPLVLVNDYDLIKELLVDRAAEFEAKSYDYAGSFLALHDGANGIYYGRRGVWREQRPFLAAVLHSLVSPLCKGGSTMERRILEETKHYLQAFRDESSRNNGEVDPYKTTLTAIGNIVSSFLYGTRYEDSSIFEEIIAIRDDFNNINVHPFVKVTQHPWTRSVPLFRELWNSVDGIKDRCLAMYKRHNAEHKRQRDRENGELKGCYIDSFLNEMKIRNSQGIVSTFTSRQLLCMTFDLWYASMGSMMETYEWAQLLLIVYPEHQQRIFDEIVAVVGTQRQVCNADRKNMPFTVAFLHPFNISRRATRDTTVGGHRVLAGTAVVPQISAVLWDERYFPNPSRFDPSRFLTADGSLKAIEQFIPFGIGSHGCAGVELANMAMFLLLANLVQQLRISKISGEWCPQPVPRGQGEARVTPYRCSVSVRGE